FIVLFPCSVAPQFPHSFPTRRSSDLDLASFVETRAHTVEQRTHRDRRQAHRALALAEGSGDRGQQSRLRLERDARPPPAKGLHRSEEHTSELQSRENLVCRLLLEKKK